MNTLILSIISIFFFQISFGQIEHASSTSDTITKINTPFTWKGSCCDNNGKSLNSEDVSNQVYEVQKFMPLIPIEINLKSIRLGSNTFSISTRYTNKIEGDTKIINLNDSLGIKFVIGKVIETGIKKYICKLLVFKMDKESNCWRPLNSGNSFFDIYAQIQSLNLYSIGYIGTKDYFQIIEGWIKFD